MIALFIFLLSAKAQASGCGFYENALEITKTDTVKYLSYKDYTLKEKGQGYVVITVDGKDISLSWEKTEHTHVDYAVQHLLKKDVSFAEGNGCGPIYWCITGQWQMTLEDPLSKTTTTYSYPRVTPYFLSRAPAVLTAKELIPVFGSMKLEKIPLKEDTHSDQDNDVNRALCSYGEW